MWDIVQIIGAILILAGFLGVQFDRLDERAYGYLIPNALGSAALAVTAVVTGNWGFVLLETVWCLVSLWGLWTHALGDRPPPGDAGGGTP